MRKGWLGCIGLLCWLCGQSLAWGQNVKVSGELRVWHKITLTLNGPQASEGGTPNPFTDVRLQVTFSKGSKSYVVPGYFAADGNAANTSATSGNQWRVHFAPDEAGTWQYKISLRQGQGVAISTSATAGTAHALDGTTGSLSVTASNKSGRDHRAKGRLGYVGKRYLQFAGNKEYFLKGGADSPENFLAFADFDQTKGTHKYAPHLKDFKTGDPTWGNGKGKAIIGALNYLASKGMNSVYFLTMNVAGDGKDVWPWTSSSVRTRFDCSKLDQWEVVFSHMDKLGLMLHVITQETENDQLLDNGNLGNQRKLYYRELIARFGHHLAVVWNLGEENTNTDAQRKAFVQFFKQNDPYQHTVVIHTYPGEYDKVYKPLLGLDGFSGVSLQMGRVQSVHSETLKWINQSATAKRQWVAFLDEIGPASVGVKTDQNDPAHDDVRHYALWGNLMAGGGGVEWYFGYQQPHNDLNCEDWRSRDKMWDLTRHALEFFQKHLPFTEMSSNDALGINGSYVLEKPGEVYAIYIPKGKSSTLQLPAGTFDVRWYNPRSGGSLQSGASKSVQGPGRANLGAPPNSPGLDWVALVTKTSNNPGPTGPTITGITLIDADADQPIGGYDPIPDGAVLGLASLPTMQLNMRANTKGTVGSVRFLLNGTEVSVESVAPFALQGDTNGDYNGWTPPVGSHTLEAIPYELANQGGKQGPTYKLTFSVIAGQAEPPPPPDAGSPDQPVSEPAQEATSPDTPPQESVTPMDDVPPIDTPKGTDSTADSARPGDLTVPQDQVTPTDQTTGPQDRSAGNDAPATKDNGAAQDQGTLKPSGCGCQTTGTSPPWLLFGILLLCLWGGRLSLFGQNRE